MTPSSSRSGSAVSVEAPPGLRAETLEVGTHRFALFEFPAHMYVPPRFTDAERAILKHLCAGCTSSEIATLRAVSTRTVANQMASMYRKMGVRSRQELIACLLAGTNR